jgi:hypothetical protein
MAILPKYDLAIVGGGAAGPYCCLRAHADEKVALSRAPIALAAKSKLSPWRGSMRNTEPCALIRRVSL